MSIPRGNRRASGLRVTEDAVERFDSAARLDQSSTARHVRRLVGSNTMGARTDNTGPTSPVRCIGGKTVACFQLRSPDRVPLLEDDPASPRNRRLIIMLQREDKDRTDLPPAPPRIFRNE